MAQADEATIAYYTVVQSQHTGWTGGLLLLSSCGRPLEFQCTLPLRPTRAHEILFGSTLRDHLIGEVIGPLLLSKCRTPIGLLCCDQPEALVLGESVVYPVALVDPPTDALQRQADLTTLSLSGADLYVAADNEIPARGIIAKLSDLPDAAEPFERIREAIKEAQSQIGRNQPPSGAAVPESTAATSLAAPDRERAG